MHRLCSISVTFAAVVLTISAAHAGEPKADGLAARLQELDAQVFPAGTDRSKELAQMLVRDVRARLHRADVRENKAWQQVQTRADWEKFRDVRLQALRDSLGRFPPVPRDLKVRVTRQLEGPGYRIHNLVFESRPGLVVTANLYLPAEPPPSMPGILIAHSHHNPRTQGELQDMGVNWARLGCTVLVPDMLGHGERRQHPFSDAGKYPRPFKLDRQDYYFRYNTGVQLHLAGDSLMGWMVWDLRRCLDLLLSRPGVDPQRVLLLGAVAGGGDPAAVTAALDPRVKAVAPFNFGGAQVAPDAKGDFYTFPFGSWESTRNLRLGARDGFAPWVIVAAAAPRRLLFAHEFSWDPQRDPAWPRLQKVFGFYAAEGNLAATAGKGNVRGKPPQSTHCNNIGPYHRAKMYPILKRWFGMEIPDPEFTGKRRKAEELAALTPEAVREFRPRPLYELVGDLAAERAGQARRRLAGLTLAARRQQLRKDWAHLLGDVEPKSGAEVSEHVRQDVAGVTAERLALEVEPGVVVPLVLLVPKHEPGSRIPVVVAVAQDGKQAFLKQRSVALAELLAGGAAVCLPDVRGTGETRMPDPRKYNGGATSLSATELLLGQTLVGSRLRDLRAVLRYLRGRADLDSARVALWGDSFAPVNPAGRKLDVPLDADPFPDQAEPLGGLLALLGALFEEDIRAVYVQGDLAGYQEVLHSPFLYVPHDALVPGALTAGDLSDVAGALAPRLLRLEGLVDGLNRRPTAEGLARALAPARQAYRTCGAADRLSVQTEPRSDTAARWLLAELRRRDRD